MRIFDLSLYLVTDSEGMTQDVFLNKLDAALSNGVTLLQLREKDKVTCDYFALAQNVKKIAAKHNIPLIIDDRIDVALACGADGVHLGQEDMPVDVARKIMGRDSILGATAKTVEQAQRAQQLGANYLGVGAIYPTKTKVKTVLTSIDTLRDICAAVTIPVVAIGGLNSNNLSIVHKSGISGISVVSAIMKADYPGEEAKLLLQKVKKILFG